VCDQARQSGLRKHHRIAVVGGNLETRWPKVALGSLWYSAIKIIFIINTLNESKTYPTKGHELFGNRDGGSRSLSVLQKGKHVRKVVSHAGEPWKNSVELVKVGGCSQEGIQGFLVLSDVDKRASKKDKL